MIIHADTQFWFSIFSLCFASFSTGFCLANKMYR